MVSVWVVLLVLLPWNLVCVHWDYVAFGGGGSILDIYPTPVSAKGDPLVYMRTDVGGIYRLVNTTQYADPQWTPLTDQFSFEHRNFYGPSAVILSKQNTLRLWAMLGMYYNQGPGRIYRSDNGGASWEQLTPVDWPVVGGSNQHSQMIEQRLAVHPHNENIILYSSPLQGLWVTTNGGKTWTRAPTNTAVEGAPYLLYERHSPYRLYSSTTSGVYMTSDNGQRWTHVVNSTALINILVEAQPDVFWGTTVHGIVKIVKNRLSLVFEHPTPMGALDVNPGNYDDIVAQAYDSWKGNVTLFHTVDGGHTWTVVPQTVSSMLPWETGKKAGNRIQAPRTLKFDPHHPHWLWTGDWHAVWLAKNEKTISNGVHWKNYVVGHEELFVFSLVSPPIGPVLLTGTADECGFVHTKSLKNYPLYSFCGRMMDPSAETFALDYSLTPSSSNPQLVVVRAALYKESGRNSNHTFGAIGYSFDGGHNWTYSKEWPQHSTPLDIATNRKNWKNSVAIVQNHTALVTHDGDSWEEVVGLPDFVFHAGVGNQYNMSQGITFSTSSGSYFYFDGVNAKLYRSDDLGTTFIAMDSVGLPKSTRYQLKTYATLHHELWIAAGENGLFRSTNLGLSFSRVDTVTDAHVFAFGRGKNPTAPPVVYVYGSVGAKNVYQPFASTDLGRTWVPLHDGANGLGDFTYSMGASEQYYGLVFVGSFGRGAFYANVTQMLN